MVTHSDYEVLKDVPGYRAILKAVLKRQIQYLVEQLARETEEETLILSASTTDGTLSHLGSLYGIDFLKDKDDIKFQFLNYCLKQKHFADRHDLENTDDHLNFSENIDEPNHLETDQTSLTQVIPNSSWKPTPEAIPINIFENNATHDETFEQGKTDYTNYINTAFTETVAVDKDKFIEQTRHSQVKRKRNLSFIPDSQRLKVSKSSIGKTSEAGENCCNKGVEPECNTELDLNADKPNEIKPKNEPLDEDYAEVTDTMHLEDTSIAIDNLTEDLYRLEQDKALLTSLRDTLPNQEHMDRQSFQTLISEAERLQLNPADIYKQRFRKLLNVKLEEGDRPYKCPLCSSCFKLHHHLKNHFSVHSRRGIYKCDLCPKSFTRKSTMKNHRRIHTGDTFYHCAQCQTTFPDPDRLLYHRCPGITEDGHLETDNSQQSDTLYVM